MGSSSSRRRRRRMSDRSSDTPLQPRGEPGERDLNDSDLATILSYLIRSGTVRILPESGGVEHMDEEFYDDDDNDSIEDWVVAASPPRVEQDPDTSIIDASDFKQEMLLTSGGSRQHPKLNGCKRPLNHMLQKREIGFNKQQRFTAGDRADVASNYLPNDVETMANYHHKAFCGTYSKEGSIFLSACQDQHVRLYDTSLGQFRQFKSIRARDVGWSVLDTCVSPDGKYLIYSSWSDYVHICNIYGESDIHDAFSFYGGRHSFAIFSVMFSSDGTEILGGANDGCMYVFDCVAQERILKIDAHEDDVNAVAFADSTSHILFSGGDDGLVKVWDRRSLNEVNAKPVGVLAGHADGVTYIDSKGDARYLLSNCKDQTIKLWDMRKFSPESATEATRRAVATQNWDYRWQSVPKKMATKRCTLPGDTSLMTYKGHSVLHTLIRCHFSPQFTTGQKYVYCGCATGAVVIFDILTGKIVKKLDGGHKACVRDVSWHPYEHEIVSTSWDGKIGLWSYHGDNLDSMEDGMPFSNLVCDSDDDERCPRRRRSKRLQDQRHGQRIPLF